MANFKIGKMTHYSLSPDWPTNQSGKIDSTCAPSFAVPAADLPLGMEEFRITGSWLKFAVWRNQYDEFPNPSLNIQALKTPEPIADIFTFLQRLPNIQPMFPYPMGWDNVAAIPLTTYENWWHHQVNKKVRKHVRRATKAGVSVQPVEFSDELVRGIMKIYNEAPVRGGRPFRHYGDDFDTCRRKHATWLDRSDFIGGFLDGELIGFIKMVYAGRTARTIQNISMIRHGSLAPGNALLAKAVEICVQKGIQYLIYGKMQYDNKGEAGLEDYKRDNGFEMFMLPKYFVPLTLKGNIAIKLGLHRDFDTRIPKPVVRLLRRMRTYYYVNQRGLSQAKPK